MDVLTLAFLASQALAVTAVTPDAPVARDAAVERIEPADRDAAGGPAGPVRSTRFGRPAPRDTVFEYSAAYYKRLDVHRAASYAMLPLFAFQYVAGSKLYDESFEAPAWARTGHRVAATGIAALFTVNTITGVMNLYEGRKDPVDRKRKVFHAVMMLAADAGFLTTGLLAERAEGSNDDRALHRTVALTSVGVATVGYLSMLDLFRRD